MILISLDLISASGFPKWDQLVGEQFGQNIQKLQENCKINIFGSKQSGRHGGQANFLGSGSRPVLLPLGQILQPGVAYERVSYKKAFNIVL